MLGAACFADALGCFDLGLLVCLEGGLTQTLVGGQFRPWFAIANFDLASDSLKFALGLVDPSGSLFYVLFQLLKLALFGLPDFGCFPVPRAGKVDVVFCFLYQLGRIEPV